MRLLCIALILAAGPVLAQQSTYPNSYNSPDYRGYGGYNSNPSTRSYYPPRPAAGPYDKPTFGDPAPRIYGQKPTLGDPRPYRNTNPRTCTGLLCD